MPREHFPCKWGTCDKSFESVEYLFHHLTDEHVGRKSTNNLCLECHWENCRTVAAKRDHLASHLRVHLPLKPHHCQLCKKGFKRPQDLKKHERIHTVEHQASLLSNQPGYKPQRRRRKPAQSTPSHKGSSELSELSSCSPSFSYVSPSEHSDNPKLFQDPLQGFINDILMDQTQPNYNTDMINRLNSIAPALQYQSSWNLPCVPESVPTLQNWLEQLSSNIQTDDNIYPSIVADSSNLVPVDYDLYPKLNDNNEWTTPSFTTQSEKTVDSPATPPISTTSLKVESESKSPNFWTPGFTTSMNEHQQNDITMTNGPFPSEPIDFSTMIRPSTSVEPNVVFETTKQEAEPVQPNLAVTFEEKKDIMTMISQFKSPYEFDIDAFDINEFQINEIQVNEAGIINKEVEVSEVEEVVATKEVVKINDRVIAPVFASTIAAFVVPGVIAGAVDGVKGQLNGQNKVKDDEADEDDNDHDNDDNDDDDDDEEGEDDEDDYETSSSSDEYSLGYPENDDKANKSPYNELLDSIGNLKLEDEETRRKRHLKLIDDLYKLVSRSS